ncbi:hypothetical protein QR98_0048230 [Sarcoptes scabiei]|uniref:Uncharacterized protein n=1 Tax=Sarcoptes scabiei TaxID=52283 RepID=A0A132A5V2_SARSC|nr:hypothetical protein QR98_0048230 [Sarcoptes scabiei]
MNCAFGIPCAFAAGEILGGFFDVINSGFGDDGLGLCSGFGDDGAGGLLDGFGFGFGLLDCDVGFFEIWFGFGLSETIFADLPNGDFSGFFAGDFLTFLSFGFGGAFKGELFDLPDFLGSCLALRGALFSGLFEGLFG